MTSHLFFLWQAIGSMAAIAVMALALGRYALYREKGALFVALAAFAQAARTLLFSLANYSRLSGLAILPADFERGNASGIAYIGLVAIAALATFRAMAGAAGLRPPRQVQGGFIVFYALDFVAALVIGIFFPTDDDRVSNLRADLFFDNPFGLAKAFLVLAALILLGRGAGRGSRLRIGALLTMVLSQLLDLSIRFWIDPQALLSVAFLAYQISFSASAFLLLICQSEGRPVGAKPPAASSAPADLLRARYGLTEEEAGMLEALISGASNKTIAWERGLSLGAVKSRLHVLYRRLGVSSRYELMAAARGMAAEASPQSARGPLTGGERGEPSRPAASD